MNFTGADLRGADLSGADVDSADFVDTRMDDVVLDGIEGLEDAYVVSILTRTAASRTRRRSPGCGVYHPG